MDKEQIRQIEDLRKMEQVMEDGQKDLRQERAVQDQQEQLIVPQIVIKKEVIEDHEDPGCQNEEAVLVEEQKQLIDPKIENLTIKEEIMEDLQEDQGQEDRELVQKQQQLIDPKWELKIILERCPDKEEDIMKFVQNLIKNGQVQGGNYCPNNSTKLDKRQMLIFSYIEHLTQDVIQNKIELKQVRDQIQSSTPEDRIVKRNLYSKLYMRIYRNEKKIKEIKEKENSMSHLDIKFMESVLNNEKSKEQQRRKINKAMGLESSCPYYKSRNSLSVPRNSNGAYKKVANFQMESEFEDFYNDDDDSCGHFVDFCETQFGGNEFQNDEFNGNGFPSDCDSDLFNIHEPEVIVNEEEEEKPPDILLKGEPEIIINVGSGVINPEPQRVVVNQQPLQPKLPSGIVPIVNNNKQIIIHANNAIVAPQQVVGVPVVFPPGVLLFINRGAGNNATTTTNQIVNFSQTPAVLSQPTTTFLTQQQLLTQRQLSQPPIAMTAEKPKEKENKLNTNDRSKKIATVELKKLTHAERLRIRRMKSKCKSKLIMRKLYMRKYRQKLRDYQARSIGEINERLGRKSQRRRRTPSLSSDSLDADFEILKSEEEEMREGDDDYSEPESEASNNETAKEMESRLRKRKYMRVYMENYRKGMRKNECKGGEKTGSIPQNSQVRGEDVNYYEISDSDSEMSESKAVEDSSVNKNEMDDPSFNPSERSKTKWEDHLKKQHNSSRFDVSTKSINEENSDGPLFNITEIVRVADLKNGTNIEASIELCQDNASQFLTEDDLKLTLNSVLVDHMVQRFGFYPPNSVKEQLAVCIVDELFPNSSIPEKQVIKNLFYTSSNGGFIECYIGYLRKKHPSVIDLTLD